MLNPDAEKKLKQNEQLSLGSDFDVLHTINKGYIENMHPVYQAAHTKAVSIVEGNRIHLDDFNYADTEKDKQAVIDKYKEINSKTLFKDGEVEALVQAEILEAMIFDLIKNHNWFGNNASAILPSAYDDLFLGNDMILEHRSGDFTSYSGVGIDITIGENSFVKKIEDTKRRISKGQLGKVKYFKSRDANYSGELNNIPHFVIGVDRDNMFALTRAWVEGRTDAMKRSEARKNIILMMIAECDEFSRNASQQIKDVYSREKRILEKVLKDIN
jgi:hypothetical protein